MWAAAFAAAVLAVAPTAAARPPADCHAGPTLVRDGRLRITGIAVPQAGRRAKVGLYACLGGGEATAIGRSGYPGHAADTDVERVVFDGTRYLATLAVRGSGTGARYRVFDLQRRRQVTVARSAAGDLTEDPFRVTASGDLARSDDGVQVIPRGFGGDPTSIPLLAGRRSFDLAYVGATLYWSDSASPSSPVVAGSAPMATPAGTPEDRVYDIARLGPYNLRRHPGRCASLSGRIIAASIHLRVVARRIATGRTLRYACAIGLGPDFVRGLGPPVGSRGELRIVADEWLLSRTASGAILIDGANGKVVARAGGGVASLTVTQQGRLAWIEGSGRLLLARSHGRAPVVLAPAADAPTALASSDETIYWTSGGVARRWQR